MSHQSYTVGLYLGTGECWDHVGKSAHLNECVHSHLSDLSTRAQSWRSRQRLMTRGDNSLSLLVEEVLSLCGQREEGRVLALRCLAEVGFTQQNAEINHSAIL